MTPVALQKSSFLVEVKQILLTENKEP
jgi:hypothetical protein